MDTKLTSALGKNFLGSAPNWYKIALVVFLIINPILFFTAGPFVAGWALVFEFIFTLAAALKCYPLGPGGLLAIEAIAIGMVTPDAVYSEVVHHFPVILLLMFMVAGVYFLQDLLLAVFTKILLGVRSRIWLGLLFCFAAALLSAFLDALTVTAVVITVAIGFYGIYHQAISPRLEDNDYNRADDSGVEEISREDLDKFRAFLCSLMMHAAVGTALGGLATLVGEPQNLLIGNAAGWDFIDFYIHVAPVSMPILVVGLATCAILQQFGWFGYGKDMPDSVRKILEANYKQTLQNQTITDKLNIYVQGCAAILLVAALALHVAEIGLIGLALLVVVTSFTGIIQEHKIGHAFTEALPFTALLVVFFAIVAVISTAGLFDPVMHWAFKFSGKALLAVVYIASGALSAISDNVFVASIYIKELKIALDSGAITPDQFQHLAVTVNAGTNVPSVATPNGQAAFLFLLTSALAPLIKLSYGRMVWMALPYTIVLSIVGFLAVILFL